MFIAKDEFGRVICAHCGNCCGLTVDHFIPKSCGMSVNENGNYVGLCWKCNNEKADRVVLPAWNKYLKDEQKERLDRIMRYSRSWIITHTDDPEVVEYVLNL